MNIKVIDAFGTHVGDAEVTWLNPDLESAPGQTIREEVAMIFDPQIILALPTKNSHMPWRLEIRP